MTSLIFFIKFVTLLVFFFCGCVAIAANPVHSAFSLIVIFLSISAVLIAFNLKFLAFVIVILYAGAISILFLFIVFTLDLRKSTQSHDWSNVAASLISLKLASVLFLSHAGSPSGTTFVSNVYQICFNHLNLPENLIIGTLMYGKFIPLFMVIGIVLLVAMLLIVILAKPFIKE